MLGNFPFRQVVVFALFVSIFSSCSGNHKEQESAILPSDTIVQEAPEPQPSYPTFITGISQDSLLAYLGMAKEVKPNRKARRPFKQLRYDKVIAYEYQGSAGEHVIEIVEDLKLASTVKKQAQLTQDQVNYITNLLGSDSTYGESYASCFNPEFGIVFFDGSKIAFHTSICLGCNLLRSSKVIPATRAKYIKIGDDYQYPAEGFSDSGGQKLVDFFKDLKIGTFSK
jgi:hypothetical protein